MPHSTLSDDELARLINAIIYCGGRGEIETLMEHCHEIKTTGGLMPHEKYFTKDLTYQDFTVNFSYFSCEGDDVVEADIQFKRSSKFPAPFWNRNRKLVKRIRRLMNKRYSTSGIEVKDQENCVGRQIHFNVSSNNFWWRASTPFEKWESECAIYDEPYSSGQTDPNKTHTRNDFVIIRFRRKPFYCPS